MCGIAGFNFIDRELLRAMTNSMEHRGPDQKGSIEYKNFSLGHRRLSIIDLSKRGRQPMCNEDGSIWVVYNGEIYNFKEIRADLEKKGHVFKSETDTEVIIHSYEEYGYDCVKLFDGMFAFGIWDGDKLFLSRDRVGIKPLYYAFFDGKFIFASEIKAIIKSDIKVELDSSSLDKLLTYRFVPGEETLFKGIKKILPGHYLLYQKDNIILKKYYNLNIDEDHHSEEDLFSKFRSLLNKSVDRMLVADVPVGAFLSGGLDSSCVVSMISKLKGNVKTFTAGFNEENDEMPYARKIANYFSTDHKEVYIDYEDMTKNFEKIVYYMDEPIADPAIFPVYFVSNIAVKDVKVALLGEGADELFGGYGKYKILNQIFGHKRYLRTDKLFLKDKKKIYTYSKQDKDILKGYITKGSNLNDALSFDFKEILPNFQLMKVDKMTMMNSLEGRVPFLCKDMVEFGSKLPISMKLNNGIGKYIIRKSMKGIVPDEILNGNKRVFFTPLKKWLDHGLREIAYDKLNKTNLFERKNVLKLIDKEKNSFRRYKYSNQLWSLLMIETWFEQFIGKRN